MQILLISATALEIGPTIEWIQKDFIEVKKGVYSKGSLEINVLVTGIGIQSTAWRLGQYLATETPELALGVGIAGALDQSMKIGDVFNVVEEQWGDFGVEEADGGFTDFFDLGFMDSEAEPYQNKILVNKHGLGTQFLPTAKGITLNKAHGNETTIERFKTEYPHAQIESLEGAAFFYACLQSGVPFFEIRSISNYVEPRNRDAWDIPLAVNNLNNVLGEIIGSFL